MKFFVGWQNGKLTKWLNNTNKDCLLFASISALAATNAVVAPYGAHFIGWLKIRLGCGYLERTNAVAYSSEHRWKTKKFNDIVTLIIFLTSLAVASKWIWSLPSSSSLRRSDAAAKMILWQRTFDFPPSQMMSRSWNWRRNGHRRHRRSDLPDLKQYSFGILLSKTICQVKLFKSKIAPVWL
jgi:hypothetical protein